MSQSLSDLLQRVRATEPSHAGPLSVYGLRHESGDGFAYLTLDDALAAGALEVTEVSDGGSVPTLRLINKSDARVFLMAGEQLVGAKQNRVLNTSLMVAGHTQVPVPVSCVEQGRWAYRSRQFGSGGTSSHSKLRGMMTKQVHDSYVSLGTPSSDQYAVWGEVSRKMDAMGSHSDSGALQQCYEDTASRMEGLTAELRLPEGCSGVAFVRDGQVIGIDLFDRPATLTKLWPKLVQSYAIDALEGPTPEASDPPAPAAVEEWLRVAAGVEAKPFPSLGLGEDVRLAGQGLVGAGLVVEAHPVHVQLFAESKA